MGDDLLQDAREAILASGLDHLALGAIPEGLRHAIWENFVMWKPAGAAACVASLTSVASAGDLPRIPFRAKGQMAEEVRREDTCGLRNIL
jgi:hypothetical protein